MGILGILFWIYAFGWQSLLMFPIWGFLIILSVYMIVKAIKNWRAVLGIIMIFSVPVLLGIILYFINDRIGHYYSYTYPIIYLLIMFILYKIGDDESGIE